MKCGRLGCDAAATVRIIPQYDPPVVRCADHAAATAEAYSKFDNRQTLGTRSVPLS